MTALIDHLYRIARLILRDVESAEDAVIDRGGSHVHIARNEGTTDPVLVATYLVPVGAGIRTDAPNPGVCSF